MWLAVTIGQLHRFHCVWFHLAFLIMSWTLRFHTNMAISFDRLNHSQLLKAGLLWSTGLHLCRDWKLSSCHCLPFSFCKRQPCPFIHVSHTPSPAGHRWESTGTACELWRQTAQVCIYSHIPTVVVGEGGEMLMVMHLTSIQGVRGLNHCYRWFFVVRVCPSGQVIWYYLTLSQDCFHLYPSTSCNCHLTNVRVACAVLHVVQYKMYWFVHRQITYMRQQYCDSDMRPQALPVALWLHLITMVLVLALCWTDMTSVVGKVTYILL